MKIIIPNAKENTNLENASFYPLSDRSKQVLDAISQFDVKDGCLYKLNEEKAELEADRWHRIRTGQAKPIQPGSYMMVSCIVIWIGEV